MITDHTTRREEWNCAPLKREPHLPYRILLVDDDCQVRDLHAAILIGYGYNVDTAENGVVAWNTLNEVTYDLLITDNNMPRLTGLELIKKVRSEGMRLPIILASGTVPVNELNHNASLQIDAIMFKPFYTDDLLAAVKKILASNSDGKQPMPFMREG